MHQRHDYPRTETEERQRKEKDHPGRKRVVPQSVRGWSQDDGSETANQTPAEETISDPLLTRVMQPRRLVNRMQIRPRITALRTGKEVIRHIQHFLEHDPPRLDGLYPTPPGTIQATKRDKQQTAQHHWDEENA